MDLDVISQLVEAALTDAPIERVIIVGMALWIWWQQRQQNKIQEKRVAGAMKVSDAVHTISAALDRNTETLKSFVLEE